MAGEPKRRYSGGWEALTMAARWSAAVGTVAPDVGAVAVGTSTATRASAAARGRRRPTPGHSPQNAPIPAYAYPVNPRNWGCETPLSRAEPTVSTISSGVDPR